MDLDTQDKKVSLQEFKEGIRSYEIATLYDDEIKVRFLDWVEHDIHIVYSFRYHIKHDNSDALKKCEQEMYENYLEKIKETR